MAVPALLDLLAPEAARRVALAQLADAAAAEQRLRHATDPEALHDFRVALRRLRSTLRAYEDVLDDTVHRKLRRALRRAARTTGESRDLEVHAQWVRERQHRLGRTGRAGARWLLARLERQRAGADRQLRRRALAGWAALHADLADALSQWTRTVHLDEDVPPPRFAAMAAVLVEQQADALREALARARADADPDALHQARIAGKRLRYLLEPLGDEIPLAAALVGELKRLQDALGVVQDAHVFAREIAAAVEAAGEERARSLSAEVAREADLDDGSAALDDPLPGLLALARRLGRERAAAQASLQRDWLGDDDPAPLAPVTEVVAALRAHAAHDA
ncbi:MAG TPA: CHAD domain-containing protein, partial [Gemmatimonadaceae bacterium]|nr:CHAD domain-containing protein [Gemmatimonadaceae bacterium]